MSFPKYPAYKDSGVEWLGQVPEHWVVAPVGSKYQVRNGYPFSAEKFSSEGIPEQRIIRIRDILGNDSPIFSDEPSPPSTIVQKDDILVGMDGDFNIAVWPNGPAKLNQRVCAIRGSTDYWERYLFYGIQAPLKTINDLTFSTTVKHLASSQILKIRFPFPSEQEAQSIANFLDYETGKIDALIEEQQRLIELLKEKRQAVISHAVTKGLDPSVQMKNSGVEWLGDVPAHWAVVPLKRVVVFQRGHDLPTDSREEGTVPVVSSGGYSGTHNVACAKAPLIVTGRYGSIGSFNFVEEDCWPLNTALYSIEIYKNEPRYVWYLLQAYAEHFLLNSLKSAVPGIDRNDIHVVEVVVAPVEHQIDIIGYLDKVVEVVDRLVAVARTSISLMQERRSALISAAVTGKIDVRGWEPPKSSSYAPHQENKSSMENI